MLQHIEIHPIDRLLDARIRPPGSKSISNRALLCAALARGTSVLTGLLDSQDTRLMAAALQQLGVQLQVDWSIGRAVVVGCKGRFPAESAELYVGNSGTTIRFLAAALAGSGGFFQLRGTARMHERPIGDLVNALRSLNVDARCLQANDCPPVEIRSTGLNGGRIEIAGDRSSQFVSGLLLAAPLAKKQLKIVVSGQLVSRPYISMTCEVMKQFGVPTTVEAEPFSVTAAPNIYQAAEYDIEPDATAASYFLGAAAICGGQVVVEGLGKNSIQGDLGLVDLLIEMGCIATFDDVSTTLRGPAQNGIRCDMRDISDTVQTLAAVSLFVTGSTTIRGVSHIRGKETDRIGNLAKELRRLGAEVSEEVDGLTIHPRALRPATIETYNDHRMAMSLALVGLKQPGVIILDPGCVSKTYPHFFADLESILVS